MLKRKNTALQLGQFLALVASLLVAGQIGYIYYQGAPLCLNDGCQVVEKLTRISPLVINGLGLFFFQLVYWGLLSARGEHRRVPSIIKNVLLAALAVEAVLISFQYLVAQTFCAYCLIIFGFVVLLNLLLGGRQIVAGVLIFATAATAFASLDLSKGAQGKQAFTAGVFAQRPGLLNYPEHHLFYSSTCAHCQKVIAALRDNAKLTIAFNPIDKVTALDLPQVSYTADYEPSVNKALLGALGIDEIPVLMTRTPDGWIIRQGETALLAYLGTTPVAREVNGGQSDVLDIPGSSDGCQVTSDCTETTSGQSSLR